MEGVGGTGHYHVGRMQHTQDSSNTSACEGCLCPNAGEGRDDRTDFEKAGPSPRPPHPRRAPRTLAAVRAGKCPEHEGRTPHRAGNRTSPGQTRVSQGRGRDCRGPPQLGHPRFGPTWGRGGRKRRWAEGQRQLRSCAAGEERPPPARPDLAEPGVHPRITGSAREGERAPLAQGGQPPPASQEMPQPRLPARRPSRDETLATRAHLRLRRPERPGRAPGRCVCLRSPRKVPTAPSESGPGPERRREQRRRRRRRRREQPTSGAAHPELLPGPLPPTPASRDDAALPARRPPLHRPPRRGCRDVRGIPPPGQVVLTGSRRSPCSGPAGTSSGQMRNALPCLCLRPKDGLGGLGPSAGIPTPEECTS
ncbi:hypothetical protein NN561_013460 [Cricetulus griseus]